MRRRRVSSVFELSGNPQLPLNSLETGRITYGESGCDAERASPARARSPSLAQRPRRSRRDCARSGVRAISNASRSSARWLRCHRSFWPRAELLDQELSGITAEWHFDECPHAVRLFPQQSLGPRSCIADPPRENEVAGAVVSFALEVLGDALRVQELQDRSFFGMADAKQSSEPEDWVGLQFGAGSGGGMPRRAADDARVRSRIVPDLATRRLEGFAKARQEPIFLRQLGGVQSGPEPYFAGKNDPAFAAPLFLRLAHRCSLRGKCGHDRSVTDFANLGVGFEHGKRGPLASGRPRIERCRGPIRFAPREIECRLEDKCETLVLAGTGAREARAPSPSDAALS